MLTSLSIKNYALIEKLSIDFSDGFSIITGETGAGKSILLGALGLVLGKRADLSSLKNKEEKCVIEGHFSISNYNLKDFFEANDLDYEDQTIIRREILPSGKSRAFINDSPVNLNELVELGEFLLDIHSQHQTRELTEELYQFQIIDAISSNQSLLDDYSKKLKIHKKLKIQFDEKKQLYANALKEQDYNSFLYNELAEAKLIENEQEELESQLEKLSNVELIKEQLEKSLTLADSEQFGLLVNLKEFKSSIQRISTFSVDYAQLFERIESLSIELKDIVNELNASSESVINDPEQLVLVNQKLQTIYDLQKKHQVTTVEELLQIQNELEGKVISVTSLESEITEIQLHLEKNEAELNDFAQKIHSNREESIPKLSEMLIDILSQLGMPNVQFKIEVVLSESFYSNGKDSIQFLISTNKGSDFGLLKKVASGGEMSRIMLAVKAILANYSNLPTLIFDEIDTGVSGEIANKMGDIMKEMSLKMQIFAITHLPQIAAKGKSHYKVYKTDAGAQTSSEIKLLHKEDRVVEIAQMLSGSTVSDSALNHAKALLN
ncbi:DNA repair protein RecN [Flavobacterium azooxidireducens]|uniref:DNA repair protein RecN n=1 Tax=Flavobacterium azooxidireducens TaxID=1871076 RepID=A0ABY4KEY4_9FLAO|nr:DNA repair protein RecN [Flavobacterium azooxidireducens]UPQ79370.1 DNA repair protein RecN [Flavobacterium azooxidireducens]